MDRDWKRFENLANHNLLEPLKDPLPKFDTLDLLSWTMVLIFVIGLVKKI